MNIISVERAEAHRPEEVPLRLYRQQYATKKWREWVRRRTALGPPLTFAESLNAFRQFGEQFDADVRR